MRRARRIIPAGEPTSHKKWTPPVALRHCHFSKVLAALGRYRETSPQMVVFGTLIRDALPT
jgi:hypothetical protein